MDSALRFGVLADSARYLGWPEKLFVRLNSLFPNVVANDLKKQLPIIKRYAKQQSDVGSA